MTSTLQQFLNNESAFGRPKPKDPTKEESYDENYGVEQMGASTETFNIPHFLNSAVVHPTTAFPREQENILGTLLTKKLAPVIEDWIEEGVKVAKDELGEDGGEKERGLAPEEFKKLWVWAVLEANDIGKKVALDEEEEYEEGDEGSREGSPGSDIEMTDVAASEALRKGKAQALEGKAMMPLDDILKFVSTGSVR